MSKFGIGTHRTTIASNRDGMTVVTYHSTQVVSYSDKSIVLNSGGYQTATTKKRMNEVSSAMGLGYDVVQRNGHWFVVWDKQIYTFVDGMRFDRQTRSIFFDRYGDPVRAVTTEMSKSIAI